MKKLRISKINRNKLPIKIFYCDTQNNVKFDSLGLRNPIINRLKWTTYINNNDEMSDNAKAAIVFLIFVVAGVCAYFYLPNH